MRSQKTWADGGQLSGFPLLMQVLVLYKQGLAWVNINKLKVLILMVIDGYWWILTLMNIDDYWWILMNIDEYWWILMYWILDIDIGFRTVANSISPTAAPKHSVRCLTTVASLLPWEMELLPRLPWQHRCHGWTAIWAWLRIRNPWKTWFYRYSNSRQYAIFGVASILRQTH